jgi:hypothetical protein
MVGSVHAARGGATEPVNEGSHGAGAKRRGGASPRPTPSQTIYNFEGMALENYAGVEGSYFRPLANYVKISESHTSGPKVRAGTRPQYHWQGFDVVLAKPLLLRCPPRPGCRFHRTLHYHLCLLPHYQHRHDSVR